MLKKVIIFILLNFLFYCIYCQNKTIKGKIISEDFETLSGVSIIIKDTIKVGKTDINGLFQVDIPISENKILFMYAGLETSKIELLEKYDNIELIMIYNCTYDFKTLKQVDRIRKKIYKKLPELHIQAFEKGIFEKKNPCYKREFVFLNQN
jgi:hypothetical protein